MYRSIRKFHIFLAMIYSYYVSSEGVTMLVQAGLMLAAKHTFQVMQGTAPDKHCKLLFVGKSRP